MRVPKPSGSKVVQTGFVQRFGALYAGYVAARARPNGNGRNWAEATGCGQGIPFRMPPSPWLPWLPRPPNWWESRISLARGVGDVVSVEHWRVQILGSAGALRTFQLERDPRSPDWFLVGITDD